MKPQAQTPKKAQGFAFKAMKDFLKSALALKPAVAFCIGLVFLALPRPALGEEDIKGSLHLRFVWPKVHSLKASPVSAWGKLTVNKSFRPGNRLKIPVYALYTQAYGPIWATEKALQVYPFAEWRITEDLELIAGRVLYESQFHQIVSLNDYGPSWSHFDGAFLKYSLNAVNISLWTAFLPPSPQEEPAKEGQTSYNTKALPHSPLPQPAKALKYGAGAFLDINLMLNYVDGFTAYAAWLNPFADTLSEKMSRYGLGLKGKISKIRARYTFVWAGHGQKPTFNPEQDMYHFLLSWSAEPFFDSKIFAGWHRDSENYQAWLYDRHNNAGLLDVFLWGNLTYWFIGLSAIVGNGFDISLSFYDFKPTKRGSPLVKWLGALSGGAIDLSAGGQEIDFQLKKHLRKDFEGQLSVGLFSTHFFKGQLFDQNKLLSHIQMAGLYSF